MARNKAVSTMALAGLLCAMMASMAFGADMTCDPNSAALVDVQKARVHDSYLALSQITDASKRYPHDFHTGYVFGLVLLDPSPHNPGPQVGQSTLIRVLGWLRDPKIAQCVKTHGWYSIYSVLGGSYLAANDISNARKYLRLGEAQLQTLDSADQASLLKNLDLLYFDENDLAKSEEYFRRAKNVVDRANAPPELKADFARRLSAIQAIRKPATKPN